MHTYGSDPLLSFSDIPERKIAGFVLEFERFPTFPLEIRCPKLSPLIRTPILHMYVVRGMKIYVTGCSINLLLRTCFVGLSYETYADVGVSLFRSREIKRVNYNYTKRIR